MTCSMLNKGDVLFWGEGPELPMPGQRGNIIFLENGKNLKSTSLGREPVSIIYHSVSFFVNLLFKNFRDPICTRYEE